MVVNPRGKHVHLYGIQSAGGGFGGFPTDGNMKSGLSTTKPQGSFEIKLARVMPKLNNGRRWVYPSEPMPQHKEDIMHKFNTFSKNFLLYGFPQSNPELPALNGRTTSVETASFMNPNSVPFYEDIAEVHKNVDSEYKIHYKEVDVKTARELFTTPEEKAIKEYHLRVADIRQNKIAEALIRKGYSEDEVVNYFNTLRERDIEKAVKNAEEEGTTPADVLQKLYNDNGRTGENATGINPLGATQNVSVHGLAISELKGLPGIRRREELRGVQAGGESYGTPMQPRSMIAEAISRRSSISSDPGIPLFPSVKLKSKKGYVATKMASIPEELKYAFEE
jgi:hypothetical protein